MIRLNRCQDARPMRFSALDYDRCRSVFEGILVCRYPMEYRDALYRDYPVLM